MLKSKLIALCKSNKLLYSLYFFFFNKLISFIKLFVKTDDRLILINSFGGKKYDDSPKAVYLEMLSDSRFNDYKFVWAFHNPEKFEIPRGEKIKTDNLRYYITALKARVWISNSGIERGLNFKGKNTFYYNSWHGTPIKIMGSDISDNNKSFKSKKSKKGRVDAYSAQSTYEAEVMSKAFKAPRERYHITGLPRNDELFNLNTQEVKKVKKEKLGIANNKRVVLFAPTFREYKRNAFGECITDWPLDFNRLREALGENYIFLLRAHYEAVKSAKIEENDFVKNVSSYPELNDLMLASDILISDYSSMFFDYSILNRPMLCFAYDYDEYSSKRGMYFDIRNCVADASKGEEALITLIKATETKEGLEENLSKVKAFRERYVEEYGSAAKQVAELIYNNIV